MPERKGIAPGYEQKTFPESERRGRWRLVAARDGRDGALTLHQDADLYASLLKPGEELEHVFREGRHGWLQVARGRVAFNGGRLEPGDGAAISSAPRLELAAVGDAELLLFDPA